MVNLHQQGKPGTTDKWTIRNCVVSTNQTVWECQEFQRDASLSVKTSEGMCKFVHLCVMAAIVKVGGACTSIVGGACTSIMGRRDWRCSH